MSEIRRDRPKLTSDKPEKKTDPASWLVMAIVIVVLVIAFAWMIILLNQDANPPDVVQRCPVGLCAFEVFTGVKRCPDPGAVEGLRIAPGVEFCTSANYCQQTPYNCAVQLDQTLDCTGVCGLGNPKCRCIANPTSSV